MNHFIDDLLQPLWIHLCSHGACRNVATEAPAQTRARHDTGGRPTTSQTDHPWPLVGRHDRPPQALGSPLRFLGALLNLPGRLAPDQAPGHRLGRFWCLGSTDYDEPVTRWVRTGRDGHEEARSKQSGSRQIQRLLQSGWTDARRIIAVLAGFGSRARFIV